METVRRALLAVFTVLTVAVPAAAQDATAAAPAGNGNFIFIWVWILIAGVIIFIVGTSMGVSSK